MLLSSSEGAPDSRFTLPWHHRRQLLRARMHTTTTTTMTMTTMPLNPGRHFPMIPRLLVRQNSTFENFHANVTQRQLGTGFLHIRWFRWRMLSKSLWPKFRL